MPLKINRISISLLIFFLFTSATVIPAAAAGTADYKLFNFTADGDINSFVDGKNAVVLSIEDSFLRIDFTGEDNPLLYTVFDEGSRFGIKDYPIIKIKYYTNSLDDIMILYYGFEEKATKDNPLNINAKQAYSADIKRGAWSEVTIDLSKIRTNYTLMTLRVDPVGCVFYNNDVFCIDYIGFFKTVEDADAYKTPDKQIPVIVERAAEESINFPPIDLSEIDYSNVVTTIAEAVTETFDIAGVSTGTEAVSSPNESVASGGAEGNSATLYYIIGTSAAACLAAVIVISVNKSRKSGGSHSVK